MPTKRVHVFTGTDEHDEVTSRIAAMFTLRDDGVVVAEYAAHCVYPFEEDGVYHCELGTLYPKDGRRFYEHLEAAFANSSFVWVIESDA